MVMVVVVLVHNNKDQFGFLCVTARMVDPHSYHPERQHQLCRFRLGGVRLDPELSYAPLPSPASASTGSFSPRRGDANSNPELASPVSLQTDTHKDYIYHAIN